jgi:hypothetical protein
MSTRRIYQFHVKPAHLALLGIPSRFVTSPTCEGRRAGNPRALEAPLDAGAIVVRARSRIGHIALEQCRRVASASLEAPSPPK